MTDRERKLKNRIQLFVASAMASFFALVLLLGVLITVNASLSAMASNLEEAEIHLIQQIDSINAQTEALLDPELLQKYIDEYILKVMGYGKDGSKIYVQ